MTPEQVFRRLIDGITSGDWDRRADLYAEDAVVEHPFAKPPERLAGRDRIREHFAVLGRLDLKMTARNVRVHETTDPEVVIAEFDYAGSEGGTGRAFEFGNVFVMTVRDGLIVHSRDYQGR